MDAAAVQWIVSGGAGLRRLARAAAGWLLALLTIGALVVFARAAGGALATAPPFGMLLAWMTLVSAAAIVFRKLVAAWCASSAPAVGCALWLLPAAVVILWAIALSLPANSPAALSGIWTIVLVEEAISWAGLWPPTSTNAPAAIVAPSTEAPLDEELAEPTIARDPAVWQHLVRSRRADGSEMIEGWLRAELAPSERQAAAHVAICPPFDRLPDCHAAAADGPGAQVKVAQILPYGVRFEIRLDHVQASTSQVTVEFAIVEHPEE